MDHASATAATDPLEAPLQKLLGCLSRSVGGEEPATPRELAEILWLAQRLSLPAPPVRGAGTPVSPSNGTEERKAEIQDTQGSKPDTQGTQGSQPDAYLPDESGPLPLPLQACPFFPPPPAALEPVAREAYLLPRRMLPGEADLQACLPLRVSIPRLLGEPRPWLVALKPLIGTQPRPGPPQLDEVATVQRTAEAGCLQPVFRPRQQPRFAITLVVDQGQAMELWQPLVEEWQQLLSQSGAFREVRRFDLHPPCEVRGLALEQVGRRRGRGAIHELPVVDPGKPVRQRAKRLGALMAADPDSLLLLISDTAGSHWWDGTLLEDLRSLCGRLPLAIVHTLPRWLARRTVLRALERTTIENREAASTNRRYRAYDPDGWIEQPRRGATLPVVSLEPQAIGDWAALVMAQRGNGSAGVVLSLDPPALQKRLQAYLDVADSPPASSPEALSALQRWEQFRDSASTEAHQLMRLLAAAPVLTLPVMRLIREAVQGPSDSGPLPLVEGLLSGLLQPLESAQKAGGRDLVRYEVVPDVAELLRDDLSAQRTVDVVRAVSNLLEQRWDSLDTGYSFVAGLIDPQVIAELRNRHRQEDTELADGLVNFATATADRLARIPGPEYQKLVAQLRSSQPPPPTWPASMAFEVQEFETAQLVAVPEIEAITFTTAWQEEIELHRIGFRTLAPEGLTAFFAQVRKEGGARAREALPESGGSAWAFFESLRPEAPVAVAADAAFLTMVEIPAGSFVMGSPETEEERSDDEGPVHNVNLESFFISQSPITQEQWRTVARWVPREGESWKRPLKSDPSGFQNTQDKRGGKCRLLEGESSSDQRPVEQVSWFEAVEFCSRLSQRTGKTYKLPSEAQWEYACRAGTATPFNFGNTLSSELANYAGNYTYADGEKGVYREQTTPVGMFPANAWGLYDMHGNVWEWCQDHWHERYEGAPAHGSAWLDHGRSVVGKPDSREMLLRGGSWNLGPRRCRSAFRDHSLPGLALSFVGFRVVCLQQGYTLKF